MTEKDDDASSTPNSTPTPTPTESGDLIFDTLWSRVVEAWDDDKPHGVIVEYAVRMQKLPELAGKYKSLTTDPDKKVRAQKRLDGVVIAATQLLMSMKTPAPPKTNKMINVVVGVIAILMLAYAAYKIAMAKHGAP